jgi:O-antigen ligase
LELAAVLGLCLPIALHQARFAVPGSRSRCWAQVALIAGAMPLTVSRSALLSLAAIAIMLLPTWSKRDRRAAYLLVLGAVIGLWVAVPNMLTVFQQLFGQIGAESSSVSRMDAYASAAQFISAHPWFGQGFQTFPPQIYFFVDNQYLTSLIETGIVGLLALVGLLATGWFTARIVRRAVTGARDRDLLQCLAASVLSAAVSFGTFDALGFTVATGLTFIILGCIGAAWRLAGTQRQAAAPD